MCGIAGYFDRQGLHDPARGRAIMQHMLDAIQHRGPDAGDVWQAASDGVVLGHRRLAIVDLSSAGAQPMLSRNGQWCTVFNGEIYNHRELRGCLESEGVTFRGHSDTEVLLEAIACWGIEAALARAVGMFAACFYDTGRRELWLARDRLGEKPLYYGWLDGVFAFASELKAIRRYPGWRPNLDPEAVAVYMRCGYVPSPLSIYAGVRKLRAGTTFCIRLPEVRKGEIPAERPYWSLRVAFERGQQRPFAGSESEAIEEIDRLVGHAVRDQMVADVPVGAFLSGGVDSSLIVAHMQFQSPRPVRTFTIGFVETGYDESSHAREVARYLGTEHTQLQVSARVAMSCIPRISGIYDEPFADSSQIPTFLVSQLARQHVTVCLSGDGGDELFGGYTRYGTAQRLWRRLRWFPAPARRGVGRVLRVVSPETWERCLGSAVIAICGQQWRYRTGERLHRIARFLESPRFTDVFLRLALRDTLTAAPLLGTINVDPDVVGQAAGDFSGWDSGAVMGFLDSGSYLPDDILVKVDRAGMAVSLENRIPLLDHRIVEFAAGLPDSFRFREGQGKWILRQVLYRRVPRAIVERPKMGFSVPIGEWLRGPLREWAESLLQASLLQRQGYFDPKAVQALWTEHQSGRLSREMVLWDILMFQAWLVDECARNSSDSQMPG